jgi:hypothetical protein
MPAEPVRDGADAVDEWPARSPTGFRPGSKSSTPVRARTAPPTGRRRLGRWQGLGTQVTDEMNPGVDHDQGVRFHHDLPDRGHRDYGAYSPVISLNPMMT